MTKSGLAKRIREARLNAGLKQVQLAAQLDVTQATVANYERGYTSPSLGKVSELARITGVDLGWLIDGDEEATA